MRPALAVDANLRVAMGCYALSGQQGDRRRFPGVDVTSSGIDFAVFNSAMLSAPIEEGLAELERRILLASTFFALRRVGWSFWLCEDLVPPKSRGGLNDLFRKHSMRVIAEPPGMIATELQPPLHVAPMLESRPVKDDKTRFDFSEVASVVFSLPYAVSRAVYGSESAWMGPMKGYVGYLEGKAVSTVAIVPSEESIGVYSLATLPQHQCRGYAGALMRRAIDEARRATGLGPIVLQTTKAGLRLYERMGFTSVTKFTVFLKEGCGFV